MVFSCLQVKPQGSKSHSITIPSTDIEIWCRERDEREKFNLKKTDQGHFKKDQADPEYLITEHLKVWQQFVSTVTPVT